MSFSKKRNRGREFVMVAALAAIFVGCGHVANAADTEPPVNWTFSVEGGVAAYGVINPAFGGDKTKQGWAEYYAEAGLGADYETGWGAFYANSSFVAAATSGEGDPGGFSEAQSSLQLESLYAGWRSGDLAAQWFGEDGIELRVGAQEFVVGDGFVISHGNFTCCGDAAYGFNPHRAFRNGAQLRLGQARFNATGFWMRSDRDEFNKEIVGFALESRTKSAAAHLTFFKVIDEDPSAEDPRNGMKVLSAGLRDVSLPGVRDFVISIGATKQYGAGEGAAAGRRFKAHSYYAGAKYSFSTITGAPQLGYRYVEFSGDDGDASIGNYDPLFYGYTEDHVWYFGDIAGSYFFFNSNMTLHAVESSVRASEILQTDTPWDIGAKYYSFRNPVAACGSCAHHWGDEVDISMDWSLPSGLAVGVSYGILWPGPAQSIAGDESLHRGRVAITFSR